MDNIWEYPLRILNLVVHTYLQGLDYAQGRSLHAALLLDSVC